MHPYAAMQLPRPYTEPSSGCPDIRGRQLLPGTRREAGESEVGCSLRGSDQSELSRRNPRRVPRYHPRRTALGELNARALPFRPRF